MIHLLTFFIFLLSPVAFAKSNVPTEKKQTLDGRRIQRPVEVLEKTRDHLTGGLLGISSKIDQFFSNEFVDTEKNDSQMKITLKVIVEDNEAPDYDFLVNTFLRLPLTEQKFQLFLTSLNADNDDSLNEENENAFGAGFRFELLERINVNIQADAGVVITDRLDPFVKIRLRNSFEFKKWTTRYIQNLYWFDSKSHEFLSEAFWDRRFNPVILYRIYTAAKWSELDKIISYEHNYNIIHQFDRRHAIIYTIGVEGFDKPVVHSDNYQMNVTLKTLIYKDWLSLSLAPGAIWRKEDGFKTRSQVMFALDMLIGSI